jgi:hypothetical protein
MTPRRGIAMALGRIAVVDASSCALVMRLPVALSKMDIQTPSGATAPVVFVWSSHTYTSSPPSVV